MSTAHVQRAMIVSVGYPACVQPEQKIIADWMQRTMAEKGWNAAEWAKRAQVNPTTISRGVSEGYESVSSVKSIEALGRAAGQRTILDHLSDARSEGANLPNEQSLEALLHAILPLVRRGRQTEQSVRVAAAALAHGLLLLGDRDASQDNDGAFAVAARGAIARFHDLT